MRVNLYLPSRNAGRTEFQGEIVGQRRQSLEVVLKPGTHLNTFLLVLFFLMEMFKHTKTRENMSPILPITWLQKLWAVLQFRFIYAATLLGAGLF